MREFARTAIQLDLEFMERSGVSNGEPYDEDAAFSHIKSGLEKKNPRLAWLAEDFSKPGRNIWTARATSNGSNQAETEPSARRRAWPVCFCFGENEKAPVLGAESANGNLQYHLLK